MSTANLQVGALHVHPEELNALRSAGLDSFDALMDADRGAVLPKKGLARWRERVVLQLGPRRLYLKRYRRPPLLEQLRLRWHGFAVSAQAEWHWLAELGGLGIGRPRGVAFGFRRHGLLERQSLVLTAEVPGRSLEKWVVAEADRLRERPLRVRLGRHLARLVARLHGAGLIHRDLYLSHIFLDEAGEDGVELYLIDLQRMMRPRLRRRRWVIKDLAALNYSTPAPAASASDRLRWWKWYRQVERISGADKAMIRAVVRKTRRIARHSARRGL